MPLALLDRNKHRISVLVEIAPLQTSISIDFFYMLEKALRIKCRASVYNRYIRLFLSDRRCIIGAVMKIFESNARGDLQFHTKLAPTDTS